MLKKILMVALTLIVGITSFSLLNNPLETDTAVANKQEHSFSKEKEEEILTKVLLTEKIQEKYDTLSFVVKTSSEKKLTIQVQGKNNLDSIKKDIESIAKNVIKSSPINEYTVFVESIDFSAVKEEHKKINKELLQLTHTLMEGLKNYDVIGDIGTEYQKSITIQTLIEGKGEEAHQSAVEIEEMVDQLLNSKELSSVSKVESYKIKILNADGKVLN